MPPAPEVFLPPARDFLYIAPPILLAAWGLLVLIADVAFFRGSPSTRRRNALGVLTLLGAVAALVLSAADTPSLLGMAYDDPDPPLFFGTLAGDALVENLNIVVCLLTALVAGLSMAWNFTEHWGEYFALLLWAAVGMMLLIASEELLTLFLTLETMTLCLYLATAFEKDRRRSPEAGLKYFVYGSVASAMFLFGLSLIYGLTGSTRLDSIQKVLATSATGPAGLRGNVIGGVATLLILVGFGFKIAAVPFHQWAPDTYEGAPAPVTAWIASGSKLASFVALIKVLTYALDPWANPGGLLTGPGWIGLLAVISAVTMTFGNLAAYAQRNLKRLLAYSSIAHAGYMLIGVVAIAVKPNNQAAAGAILFYLVTYSFATIGVFALAAWLARDLDSDDIDDLNGMGYQSPALAVCILLLFLSLIGMPPLAGFFGKLYMFMEALNSGEQGRLSLTWLVFLGFVNTLISAYYYVRVLRAMFLRPTGRRVVTDPPLAISVPVLLCTIVVLGFGLVPAPLLNTMTAAAVPMLSTGGQSAVLQPKYLCPGEAKGSPRRDVPPPTPEETKRYMEQFRVGGGAGGGSPPPAPAGPDTKGSGPAAPKGEGASPAPAP